MKEAFAQLLSSVHVRMPQLIDTLAKLLAKRLSGGDASSQPSAEDTDSVGRLLTRIFNVNDVIYKKVITCWFACHSCETLAVEQVRYCNWNMSTMGMFQLQYPLEMADDQIFKGGMLRHTLADVSTAGTAGARGCN